MNLQRIETADGSSTLRHAQLGETYHSTKGARSESLHVYIKTGLEFMHEQNPNRALHILEIGYGIGMNAQLTLIHARQPIFYTGIEPVPIPKEEYITSEELYDPKWHSQQRQIATTPWETPPRFHQIHEHFHLKKQPCALMDFCAEPLADLVYFDAFAPKYQPELWTAQSWNHLRNLMKPNASAVTYCAQGAFRRMLEQCGWMVHRLPGPKGQKLEMIRAFRT